MLNTADIEGAHPQKFRLKHKRHEYIRSPYHSSVERTTFTNSFKKMVIPHDVYHVPDIAPKITNIPAPVVNEVDPFGVSIRKDKFRDNDGRRLQQSSTLESLSPSRQPSQSSIKLMQVPSEDARRENQVPQQQPQQQEIPRAYQDEQRQSRNNFNDNNFGASGVKPRRSQSNFMPEDSIDKLRYEVDSRKLPTTESESPNQIKKALHNFYGVTPPATQTSYYKNIELKRQDSDQEQKLTESYYQNRTRDAIQKAQQDTKFNKAMKDFFGATNTEPGKPQGNLNKSYALPGYQPTSPTYVPSYSPTYAPSNLLSEQKKIDYSFGGYGHSQYFQPKTNLNSRAELPFTLDPLTHQKIYKTGGVKHQNNYSVQLETKPENDYFYVKSNSPASKLYNLH